MVYATLGPTGCGKTTLIEHIASRYQIIPIKEEWESNPYLLSNNIYAKQKWFIENDIDRLKRIFADRTRNYIIDKLFIQNYIFIDNDDFTNHEKTKLRNLVDNHLFLLNYVDTIIYFDISTEEIMRRIFLRDREIERTISSEWINRLNISLAQLVTSMMQKYQQITYYKYTKDNTYVDKNKKHYKDIEFFCEYNNNPAIGYNSTNMGCNKNIAG